MSSKNKTYLPEETSPNIYGIFVTKDHWDGVNCFGCINVLSEKIYYEKLLKYDFYKGRRTKPLSCPSIMPKKQKIKIEHAYQNTPNKQ